MIGTRAGRAAETVAAFIQERFTERAQARVFDRPGPFTDVIPIGGLLRAQFGRPLQKLGSFLRSEMANLPSFRIQPKLLMLLKFPAELDEVGDLQRIARFEFRMIAPDPQRHSVGHIRETQLAIRLLLARDFARGAFHLDVDARFQRAALRASPDFGQRHQLHRGIVRTTVDGCDSRNYRGAGDQLPACSTSSAQLIRQWILLRLGEPSLPEGRDLPACYLWFGDADHAAGETAAGIASRLRPIVDLLVNDHTPAKNGILAAQFEHVVFQFQMRFAGAVRFDIAKIAGMPFGRVRSAVWLVHRIEMPARGRGVGRRAIAEFMNVEAMFARREPGDVGDYLHRVASFRESDSACHLASRRSVQDGDRFSGFLSEGVPESKRQRDRNQRDDVEWLEGFVFHESKIRLHGAGCKLQSRFTAVAAALWAA
jgi:hypothetical protein